MKNVNFDNAVVIFYS